MERRPPPFLPEKLARASRKHSLTCAKTCVVENLRRRPSLRTAAPPIETLINSSLMVSKPRWHQSGPSPRVPMDPLCGPRIGARLASLLSAAPKPSKLDSNDVLHAKTGEVSGTRKLSIDWMPQGALQLRCPSCCCRVSRSSGNKNGRSGESD